MSMIRSPFLPSNTPKLAWANLFPLSCSRSYPFCLPPSIYQLLKRSVQVPRHRVIIPSRPLAKKVEDVLSAGDVACVDDPVVCEHDTFCWRLTLIQPRVLKTHLLCIVTHTLPRDTSTCENLATARSLRVYAGTESGAALFDFRRFINGKHAEPGRQLGQTHHPGTVSASINNQSDTYLRSSHNRTSDFCIRGSYCRRHGSIEYCT